MHWCKREHVESNALNNWKLRIFKIIDECVLFYSNYCTRWYKRERVEFNALNNWNLNIFKIIGERVLFYSNDHDLLPPKPKLAFRYLKQGIQEFHRNYVLAPADITANNVVVVWRLHYINTLIQEIGSTKTYKRISTDARSIVNAHSIEITAQFAVSIKKNKAYFLRYIVIENSWTTL